MITKIFKKGKNSTISSLFAGIVVIIAMFMVVACEKEETVIDKSPSLRDPKSVLYNLKVDEDGIIMFKDYDEFNICTDLLIDLTSDDFKAWEKKIGFLSYRSYSNFILNELSEVEQEDQIFEILSKYPDDIYLGQSKDGDNSVEWKIPTTIYTYFANSERLYIIGDSIYKVFNDCVVHTSIRSKKELQKLEEKCIAGTNFVTFRYRNNFKNSGCGTNEVIHDTVYNPTGCSDDRRVTFTIETAYVETGPFSFKVTATSDIRGNRKFSCIWVGYKTILNYRNIDCTVLHVINGVGSTDENEANFPDYNSSSDETSYQQTVNVFTEGSSSLYWLGDAVPHITYVRAQFKSRAFTSWALMKCD